jgi:hypothetical protein
MTKYKEFLKKDEFEFDQFWQKNSTTLPLLTNAVHNFCLINATSVPSESTFSVGGIILGKVCAYCNLLIYIWLNELKKRSLKGKHRTSMQPQTLRYTLLLKDKLELMDSLEIVFDDESD